MMVFLLFKGKLRFFKKHFEPLLQNSQPTLRCEKQMLHVPQYSVQFICSNEGHIPREALPTHRADVGLVNSTIMGANMICHAILPLEPLLADGTLKRLLIRVGQFVAIEMVNISKGLTTHVTAMILFYWLGGLLRDTLLMLVLYWGHYACTCGC